MADCRKCQRTDIKCCFTCKKNAGKCNVLHHCGSDCPEHESIIKTNADKIRAMSDEELKVFLFDFLQNYSFETDIELDDWLQSEVEE